MTITMADASFWWFKKYKEKCDNSVLMFGAATQVPNQCGGHRVVSNLSLHWSHIPLIGPAANIDNSGSRGHRLQQIMGGLQRYLAEPKGQPDIYCWPASKWLKTVFCKTSERLSSKNIRKKIYSKMSEITQKLQKNTSKITFFFYLSPKKKKGF